MQLVDSYQSLPGSCKNCGNSSRLPVVDMGWQEEFHGAIYLCMTCVEELVSVCGFFSKSSIQLFQDENARLTKEIELAKLEVSLNGSILKLLKPVIDAERDLIRKEYKERLNVEQTKLGDEFDSRVDTAVRLAILDYEAAQEQSRLSKLNDEAESDSDGSDPSGQQESLESGSLEGLADLQSSGVIKPGKLSL